MKIKDLKKTLSGMYSVLLAHLTNDEIEALHRKYHDYRALGKYERARNSLRKAAEMGHLEAMYDCAIDYMSGDGFSQDNKQAYHWLRKAAEQGHADAQFFMGLAYERGMTEPPKVFSHDLPEAYKWFKLAAGKKAALVNKNFKQLRSLMTPIQLEEGERRYREFQPTKSNSVQISTAIKPASFGIIIAKLIAVIMLFAALGHQPYDYYILLHWVACGVAAFTAFQALQLKKTGWLIVFVIVSAVNNPLAPIHLKRDAWAWVDVAAALLLLLSIAIMDIRKHP